MIHGPNGLQESRSVTAFRQGLSVRLESLPRKQSSFPRPPFISLWLYGLVSGPDSVGLHLAGLQFLLPRLL